MHIIGTNFLSLLLNGEAKALEKVKKEGPENFSVGQWSLDELKISETELPVKGMHVIFILQIVPVRLIIAGQIPQGFLCFFLGLVF